MAMTEVHQSSEKPTLRGVSHVAAFFVSLFSGAALIALSADDAVVVASVYAFSVSGLLGVSGAYHWLSWNPKQLAFMRQLDHTMIFVLIAGTYSPFALYTLDATSRTWVLFTVWGAVGLAFFFNLVWPHAPRWLHAGIAIAAGMAGVTTLPQIAANGGTACLILVLTGGILYVIGATCYALKKPNPIPGVFGHHEVFHILVILAAGAHYAAIYNYVLPLEI